jgi:hypothetical protein
VKKYASFHARAMNADGHYIDEKYRHEKLNRQIKKNHSSRCHVMMRVFHDDENGGGWMLAVVVLALLANLRQQRRTGLYFERGPTSAVLCFGHFRRYQRPSRSTTIMLNAFFFKSPLISSLMQFSSAFATSSFQPLRQAVARSCGVPSTIGSNTFGSHDKIY